MIPKGSFIFIIIIIIDMILKRGKDKNKAGDTRNRRARDLGRKPMPIEKIETIKRPHIDAKNWKDKFKPLSVEKNIEMESSIEKTISIDDDQIIDEISEIGETDKKKRSHKRIKDDILKGIIFSEILSRPKGFRGDKSI